MLAADKTLGLGTLEPYGQRIENHDQSQSRPAGLDHCGVLAALYKHTLRIGEASPHYAFSSQRYFHIRYGSDSGYPKEIRIQMGPALSR